MKHSTEFATLSNYCQGLAGVFDGGGHFVFDLVLDALPKLQLYRRVELEM